jgi:hypothetical protein
MLRQPLSFAVMLFALCATASDKGAPTLSAPAVPARDDWQGLSFVQRHERMTFLVHPTLAERWQAHYHTPAPRLSCASCHGENAEQHRYQMAYSPLDALAPARVQALYRADARLSEEQSFKRDVVTPLMADLLGVARYDPATGLGFSCFGCHPREVPR